MKRLSFFFILPAIVLSSATMAKDIDLNALFESSDDANSAEPSTRTVVREVDSDPQVPVVANRAIASDRFNRIDGKTPCYYLFRDNNFQTNDEIKECRISLAKKMGHEPACRNISGGVQADLNACLINRGTSQKSIDEREEYLENLREAEARARRDGKIPAGVPVGFNYNKTNSKIYTFHFWEMIQQHQVPILYGRTKEPMIRITSWSRGSDGVIRTSDNARDLKLYNTPDQACRMLKDEDGNSFHAVFNDPAGRAFDVGRPEGSPFRVILRDVDGQEWNGGNRYQQRTDIIGINEDGNWLEVKRDKQCNKKCYFSYVMITCVRKLNDGEQADEDQWKKEIRLMEKLRRRDAEGYKELYDYRRNGDRDDNQSTVLATPIYLPDGSVIYESGTVDQGTGRSGNRNYNQFTIDGN